jgi:hypothetical protein
MKGTFSFIAVSISCIGCRFLTLIGADLQAVLEYSLIFSLGRLDFYETATILEFVCSKKLSVRITELHQRIIILSANSFCGTMSALGQKRTCAAQAGVR